MFSWRRFAVAAALSVATGAQASTYSDLWWNPLESGWGANVVQQDDTAFVTLFVYGADGKPTWFSGDARIVAIAAGNLPQFSGSLYRAQGPYFGGPFNPSDVHATRVGDLGIETLAADRLRLTYEVDGVRVVKELIRQTFKTAFSGGTYLGAFNLRQSLPGGTPIGTFMYQGEVSVVVENGQARVSVLDNFRRQCDYQGAYAQAGKLATVNGHFTCGDGTQGTFEITSLEVTTHGITGQLRTASATLNENGRFAAARQF